MPSRFFEVAMNIKSKAARMTRDEELAAINTFIAERGVTRLTWAEAIEQTLAAERRRRERQRQRLHPLFFGRTPL